MILEIIPLILAEKQLDGAGGSLRQFLDEFKEWHNPSPSNEVIWIEKISNYMQGLKSALARFQNLFLLWAPMNSLSILGGKTK